jgi:hypothetical protein
MAAFFYRIRFKNYSLALRYKSKIFKCCLGSITPQDFNQPNIRRHTVIPALHDNHLSAPAFARR